MHKNIHQNNNNTEKIEHQPQRKNNHKYIFSKHNILNHENSIESIETKLATNTKEYNTKNYLTNSSNNTVLTKLKNKIKEKQELSYMIIDSKKFKKNIPKYRKTYKSLEKNKKTLKKKKKNEEPINNKYPDIISPLNKGDNLKTIQNNLHKRVNSSHIYNKVEKENKYNKSFRETKKKIKINNKSIELSIDNNDESLNENYEQKITLTNMNNNENNNIDNSEYLLSEQKNELNEEEIINNEEIINMSKKKEKLLEEIKLKKQELKLTELNLEILRHKYRKKSNEQTNPVSSSHINNKIISNYDLNISLPQNPITKKNCTINNDSTSFNKKSFFAKTSLYKNRKKISPTYNNNILDLKHSLANDRLNHSLKLRHQNNHGNVNIKMKNNNTIRNNSNNSEISPYNKRVFSLPKKKSTNNGNNISKNNISIKYVSPEKNNENSSIEIGNYNFNKTITTNNNMNKKKIKINNSINTKNKSNISLKKKNNKKEINIKQKILNTKKNFMTLKDNKRTKNNTNTNLNDNANKNKINIKRENIKNEKNEKNISRNNIEKTKNSFFYDIKINESDKDIKSLKSINDLNLERNSENKDNIYNNINKECKSISILESICKKGFAGPGIKKTNQDNFFIYNNFNNNTNYIYMGICDGHGMFGQGVSTFLVNNLPQNLNSIFLNQNIKNISTTNITTLSENILSIFVSTNEQLTQDDRIDSAFSGSTCVSLIYTPSRLICINVGDSRCVLGKFDGEKWKSQNLSRDHKPNISGEKERIIKSGGRVEAYKDNEGNFVGPDRVWLQGGDLPGLAMSRSFGDEVAHLVGVITEPEIVEYYFSKEDKFIILGSDGLWEFINSQECVEIVKDFYLEKNVEGALTYLYKEASKRWILEEEIIDDITILIAFLKE